MSMVWPYFEKQNFVADVRFSAHGLGNGSVWPVAGYLRAENGTWAKMGTVSTGDSTRIQHRNKDSPGFLRHKAIYTLEQYWEKGIKASCGDNKLLASPHQGKSMAKVAGKLEPVPFATSPYSTYELVLPKVSE